MSLKQFSTRLEISFWNLTIDLLTESPIIQKMVKWVYDHFTLNEWHLFANLDASHALRWASAGLGFGLAAGLLANLF